MTQLLLPLLRFIIHRFFCCFRCLHYKIKVRLLIVICRQIFRIDKLQNALNIHMAVQNDLCITRMIKALVCLQKFFIRQIRNLSRMATADIAIAVVREQQTKRLGIDHLLHIGKLTLHLTENHTIIIGLSILRSKLVMPALLHKDLRTFIDHRMEYAVQIHAHQIKQILLITAGYRKDRLVTIGHGI